MQNKPFNMLKAAPPTAEDPMKLFELWFQHYTASQQQEQEYQQQAMQAQQQPQVQKQQPQAQQQQRGTQTVYTAHGPAGMTPEHYDNYTSRVAPWVPGSAGDVSQYVNWLKRNNLSHSPESAGLYIGNQPNPRGMMPPDSGR